MVEETVNRWCAVTKDNDARIEIAAQMFRRLAGEAKCFNNLALFLNGPPMSFMRAQSRGTDEADRSSLSMQSVAIRLTLLAKRREDFIRENMTYIRKRRVQNPSSPVTFGQSYTVESIFHRKIYVANDFYRRRREQTFNFFKDSDLLELPIVLSRTISSYVFSLFYNGNKRERSLPFRWKKEKQWDSERAPRCICALIAPR